MFDNKYEKRWALYAGSLIMLITTIPYIIAYWQGNDMIFSGFLFGVEDGNSYIAKMLSGNAGAWLFKSPYTTFSQKGFIAFLPYLLIGKLVSSPAQHEQLVVLFHLFRLISGILLTVVTYIFISIFIKNIHLRKIATVITLVGGGLGWLSLLGLSDLLHTGQPLELYSPETFGFLSIFGLPHLLAAKSFLLLGLILFLKNDDRRRNNLAAGVCWFLVSFFQPLTIVTGWIILTGFLVMIFLKEVINKSSLIGILGKLKPQIYCALTMIFISSPWVLYNFLSFEMDPYLSGWASQNLILSPPIWDYLLSFSIFLPFVFWGLWKSISKTALQLYLLLVVYALAFPFLAYAPYNLQRRLPDGIWLAMVILALLPFDGKEQRYKISTPQFLLGISLISPIILLAGALQTIFTHSIPVYRPKDEIKAFEFIYDNSSNNDIVLASYETSNAIPAWAVVRVLAGHGPESVQLEEVYGEVENFYGGELSTADQLKFIEENSIDFILYGPSEKELGYWNPESMENIEKIYDQNGYSVYQIGLDEAKKNKK